MTIYTDSIRDDRMTLVLNQYHGSTMYLCSGIAPVVMVVPDSSVILSEHAIAASGGAVTDGRMFIAGSAVGEDSAANTSGEITHIVFVKGGVAVGQHDVPGQISIKRSGVAVSSITAGARVAIDSIAITEGNTAAATTSASPVNTVVPTIAGIEQVDETLTLTNATWSGAVDPTTDTLQRSDDGTSGWAAVAGVSGNQYVFVAGDALKYFRVESTATNPDGTTTVHSTLTVPIVAAPTIDSGQTLIARDNWPNGYLVGHVAFTGSVYAATTDSPDFSVLSEDNLIKLFVSNTGASVGNKTVAIKLNASASAASETVLVDLKQGVGAPVVSAVIPNSQVANNAATGTLLATLSATNPNPDTAGHVWAVASNTAWSFNSSTGQITVADEAAFAALAGSSVSITASATNTVGYPVNSHQIDVSFVVAAIAGNSNTELWAQPAFDSLAGINQVDANWSVVNGQLVSNGGSGNLGMTGSFGPLTAGVEYIAMIDLITVNGGSIYFGWDGASGHYQTASAPGHYEYTFTAQEPADLKIWSSSFDGVIDNYTVKQTGGAVSKPAPIVSVVLANAQVLADAVTGTLLATLSATNPNAGGPPDHLWTADSNAAWSFNSTTRQITVASESAFAALEGSTVTINVSADNTEGSPSTGSAAVQFNVVAPAESAEIWPQTAFDSSEGLGFDGTGFTVSGGQATATGTIANIKVATPPLIIGKTYTAKIDVVSISAGAIYFGWDGVSGHYKSVNTVGTHEYTFTAQATQLYVRSASAVAVIDNYSVKEVVSSGGGGGGGAVGPQYNNLKAKLDEMVALAGTGSWVSDPGNGNPGNNPFDSTRMTVVDGYNSRPAFVGLKRAWEVTGQQPYVSLMWTRALLYINSGNEHTSDAWNDWYSQYKTGNWNHDHYEWRAAAGIGLLLNLLIDNPSLTLSTTANRNLLANWLRDHVWLKWQPGNIAGASNINQTCSYMRSRIGMFVIPLHKHFGDAAYSTWLTTKGGEITAMIDRNTNADGSCNMWGLVTDDDVSGSPSPGTLDVAHAADIPPFLVQAYKAGYTWVTLSHITKLTKTLNIKMWAADSAEFYQNIDRTGPIGSNISRNVEGWFTLIEYDTTHKGAFISWALRQSPLTMGSAMSRETRLATAGLLL